VLAGKRESKGDCAKVKKMKPGETRLFILLNAGREGNDMIMGLKHSDSIKQREGQGLSGNSGGLILRGRDSSQVGIDIKRGGRPKHAA